MTIAIDRAQATAAVRNLLQATVTGAAGGRARLRTDSGLDSKSPAATSSSYTPRRMAGRCL